MPFPALFRLIRWSLFYPVPVLVKKFPVTRETTSPPKEWTGKGMEVGWKRMEAE